MTPGAHQALAARIRTDLNLWDRSKAISNSDFNDLHKAVERDIAAQFDGLGYSNLSYPQALLNTGFRPDQTLDERKEIAQIEPAPFQPSEDEARLLNMLENGADSALTLEWQWRAGEHCQLMNELGWYPFFLTLTVDPLFHDPAIIFGPRQDPKKKTPLQAYWSKLARIAMKECGLTRAQRDKASDRDYFQHFCTIEHGKSGAHHHAHAIVWFRAIPDSWKLDPNFGQREARNRRCRPLETYWTYCVPEHRPANYYWFLGCPWQKLGHRVPVDEFGKGFDLMPANMGGFYCAKYMGKEDKQWKHRVKASRSLGLRNLLASIKHAPTRYLEQMVTTLPTFEHLNIQTTSLSVPMRLLRRLSRLELYSREYSSMSLTDLLTIRPKPFSAMLSSLRETKPWRLASRERYAWLLGVLPPATKEFCEDTWFDSLLYFQNEGFVPLHVQNISGIGGYSS